MSDQTEQNGVSNHRLLSRSARRPVGEANPSALSGHGGGTGDAADVARRLQPVTDAKRIRVTFNASVSDVLPWKFVPQQREVRVLPGETALAFYTATNKSDARHHRRCHLQRDAGTDRAVLQQDPVFLLRGATAQRGETVDMPVFFYLDPDMLDDLNMRGIETVTLSYTFLVS